MKKNYIILSSITIFIIVITASIALGYNSYKKSTMIITGENNGDISTVPSEESNLIEYVENNDIKKLNSIIEDEREKLKYDEAINIEFKGKKVVITGVQPLEKIEEIKEYYPTVNIPSNIENYNFERALIFENSIGNYYISDEKIVSQEELGRVYKRELNVNNIKYINLRYGKNSKYIILNIYVGENTYNEEKLNEKYNVEVIQENEVKYSILREKSDNSMKGIYFELDVDKESYYINVNMTQSNGDGEVSGKEIEEFLKTMNMVNFIKQLNITNQESK